MYSYSKRVWLMTVSDPGFSQMRLSTPEGNVSKYYLAIVLMKNA